LFKSYTHTSNGLLVGLVGLIGFLSAGLAGYGGAGWQVWMSDIIPRSLAGRFFGLRARLGLLSMCLSAFFVGWLLDRFAGQGWVYSVIFCVAALFGATDILLFIPIREAPREPEHAHTPLREILLTPLRDPQFRSFAVYTVFAWIAYNMSGPFVWRFCFDPVSKQGMGMSAFTAQSLLVIIPWLAMAWAAPYWGRAIDRFGTKPVLMFSSMCNFIFPLGWVIMRPGLEWLLWVIAITVGLTWPGIDQVVNYMQIKGFPDTRRATYNAAYALVLGVGTMLGTALGGVYASFWQTHLYLIPGLPPWVSHYHPVILTAMVLRVACFVFLLTRLKLPGTAHYTVVARDIASGLSSSLPRVGGRRRRN
jgi:MFS family permease